MKPILIAIVIFLSFSACGNKGRSKNEPAYFEKNTNLSVNAPSDAAVGGIEVRKPAAPAGQDQRDVSKKIIKEGDISFETPNVYDTRKAITNSLQRLGGYVAEESEVNNSDNGRKEYTLKARVPAKSFDLFLNNVSSNAEKIDTKNIRIKDVTTEFIDITTQLANKKKLEDRYLELLKKGDKISDLLQIENKLNEIRTDIESTQAQLNYLTKQVEYSSLDIVFYSRQAAKDDSPNFIFKLKTSLSDGWDILGSLFFGFIGWWPIWIVTIVLYVLLKRWRKKRRLQKANP